MPIVAVTMTVTAERRAEVPSPSVGLPPGRLRIRHVYVVSAVEVEQRGRRIVQLERVATRPAGERLCLRELNAAAALSVNGLIAIRRARNGSAPR